MDHTTNIIFQPPGDEHYESAAPKDRWPRLTRLSQAVIVLSASGVLICLQILAWSHA